MKPKSCIYEGEVYSQESGTIPPWLFPYLNPVQCYGQWSVAKVQVKHIMHYLGGLFTSLRLSWISFVCVYCICACILSAREWERAFVLSSDREDCVCICFDRGFQCTRAETPLCFLSLYVHCVGSGQIVHAKASECAAMIMGQGQECQPQRWELVIFKRAAWLPWLLLNVNTTVKHCSEPCAQLHSAPSKTDCIAFSHKAEKSTVRACWCCGR